VLSHLGALAPLLTSVPMPRFAIRRFLAGEDATDELVSEIAEAIRSVRPGCIAARIRQVLSLDVSAEAARCPVPVLYLAGRRDRLVSLRSEAEFRALLPAMTTQVLDAPHLVLQRRPAEAAQAITQFLSGLP
jgi:pimeloyl-ACP methyl ester carboxylesterase